MSDGERGLPRITLLKALWTTPCMLCCFRSSRPTSVLSPTFFLGGRTLGDRSPPFTCRLNANSGDPGTLPQGTNTSCEAGVRSSRVSPIRRNTFTSPTLEANVPSFFTFTGSRQVLDCANLDCFCTPPKDTLMNMSPGGSAIPVSSARKKITCFPFTACLAPSGSGSGCCSASAASAEARLARAPHGVGGAPTASRTALPTRSFT
mmetsp:Transcript_37753/g.88300  ORF Transcript_37753/g.88300 Transcript_37753/m.88300 type:complete len:205 (-) Transcript_37753:466-1080(-)